MNIDKKKENLKNAEAIGPTLWASKFYSHQDRGLMNLLGQLAFPNKPFSSVLFFLFPFFF